MKKSKEWKPDRYIFALLRRVFRWSPERKRVLENARQGKDRYVCFTCKSAFNRKGVAVDHREPVVDPVRGFQGWDIYVARLFVKSEALQVLCKACHKLKSIGENKIRAITRRQRRHK